MVMKDDDIDRALLSPMVMVGSDGLMSNGQGHPRAAGSFPRFWAEFVRKGTISPYEAVEKMTAAGLQVDAFDALTLAEQAGSPKAVNIVLMGHLSRNFDFTEEEWMQAIEQSVPAKFLELNKKAFILGRNA